MKVILRVLFVCCAVVPVGARGQAPAGPVGTPTYAAAPGLGGGFQVGDRVFLQVEGDSQFTGTFAVGPGPALMLPVIGAIPLGGVRRAEVEPYLTQQLGRYLKRPMVRAKALIHLSIIGEVEHPGFYSVPVDIVLGDALMQAGGPTRDAKVPAMRIERDADTFLQGDSLQLAFAHGLTVDQVGLRDGDRIVVPRMIVRDAESKWRVIGILVTIPVAIYGITRLGH